MTESQPYRRDDFISLSARKEIDAICDRFEEAWDRDEPPRLEDVLVSGWPTEQQQALARDLLIVELDRRRAKGQEPAIDEYLLRFPEFQSAVHQVFPASTEAATLATVPPNVDREHNSQQIGPYKLLQQIGGGGMGTVWMAEQEEPVRRRVALKLIKAGMADKQVIARFEAERQALAMMDHQNIARVLDAGTTADSAPYFVMELVLGIPITEYCDRNRLTPRERLEIFVPICHAVQHAHQKGIIHRDLKPSNVLVHIDDGEPVVKVIDFGLAKALQHQTKLTDKTMFTEFGQVLGTVQYMSPEQATLDALDIDTRSDIYSLGVMLYELLAGSTPIDEITLRNNALLQVLEIIREKDPPRPSHRLSSSSDKTQTISERRQIPAARLEQMLRGELDWIVIKALEKDRTRRYASANDFAEDIQRYLDDEVVRARPPSTAYRARKFVSKNRSLVATVTTIFALLIAGMVGTSWFAIKVREAEALTNAEKDKANEAMEVAEARLARSNYFLANARWNDNRVAEAHAILESIPDESRYFEWYRDRRRFLGSDMTLYGHGAGVSSVTFSCDGALIVSGGHDNMLKVWDPQTGAEMHTLTGHDLPILCAAFSPDSDRIVSGGHDNTLKLWDVGTGTEIQSLKGHTDWVFSVAFSNDGRWLVSGSKDNTLKLWDARTGREIWTLAGHGPVKSVTFSPDSSRVVSATFDNTLRVWEVQSGKEIKTLDTPYCNSVVFSPDGNRIVAGSWNGSIKLWDTRTGAEIRMLAAHTGSIHSVAFSPDGSRLVSGSDDTTLKLWDMRTGGLIKTLRGHTHHVQSVAFSPDGTRLVSASLDATLKLWDGRSGTDIQTIGGHTFFVNSVAFSPDNSRIVSGSDDTTLKLWEVRTGEEIQTYTGHKGCVTSVAFSPDGSQIVSGSSDTTLKLWDGRAGTQLRTLTGHSGDVTSVAFSPDGSQIVSGSSDTTLKLWDMEAGEEVQTLTGHVYPVECVAFSSDGIWLASGSKDTTLKLWNVGTGEEVQTLTGHTRYVKSVAFSPDGTRLVSGSSDATLKLWDVGTGEEVQTLTGHTGYVTSVAFSPDGTRLVSGSSDATLKLWDVGTGEEVQTLTGHTGYVLSVAFSPDGIRLVSGGTDTTLKIWNAPTTAETRTLRGHHNAWVESVTFSADGNRIYSSARTPHREYKFVWDSETGERLSNDTWQDVSKVAISPNGRWLVVPSVHDVLLVDREFGTQADEKAYRESKARPHPRWHHREAKQAEQNQDWYASTFHRAWVVKYEPDSVDAVKSFRATYDKLAAEFAKQNKEVSVHLAPVIREVLKITGTIAARGADN